MLKITEIWNCFHPLQNIQHFKFYWVCLFTHACVFFFVCVCEYVWMRVSLSMYGVQRKTCVSWAPPSYMGSRDQTQIPDIVWPIFLNCTFSPNQSTSFRRSEKFWASCWKKRQLRVTCLVGKKKLEDCWGPLSSSEKKK